MAPGTGGIKMERQSKARAGPAARHEDDSNLAEVLLAATPNPPGIARELELPAIEHAVLAADSIDWRNTHATSRASAGTVP
jgi:hypothetical protein